MSGSRCVSTDVTDNGNSWVITGIGELTTNDHGQGDAGVLHDAAVVVEEGLVVWVGRANRVPHGASGPRFDCGGAAVLPGFVDSHSHLVFAGDRSAEFAARMGGRPYEAGGIRVTVDATRAASDEALLASARMLRREASSTGTTTLEVKSGYGLNVADETRIVRLAGEVSDEVTFLGAHVVPSEFAGDPDGYVDLVCGPMLEACAPHARWIDVFCERGAFDVDQSRRILLAGASAGLTPRVHANQLGEGPGAQLAVEVGAASADHLTFLSDADVEALASSSTVATLLPGVEFSTRSPYPRARRLLDAGATVALAANCNPGSCFTTSMGFVIALAVREMNMSVEEAVFAATAGGAAALRRSDIGRIAPGQRADLQLLAAPSAIHLAYRPGVPLTAAVWQSGVLHRGVASWSGVDFPESSRQPAS